MVAPDPLSREPKIGLLEEYSKRNLQAAIGGAIRFGSF